MRARSPPEIARQSVRASDTARITQIAGSVAAVGAAVFGHLGKTRSAAGATLVRVPLKRVLLPLTGVAWLMSLAIRKLVEISDYIDREIDGGGTVI